jgi:ABC-type glycerol-3-phosphate transport system substrate-binding protein
LKLISLMAILLIFAVLLLAGCAPTTPVTVDSAGSSAAISEDHEYSVEIEGSEMKKLTIKQVASMWGIDAQKLLNSIIAEFKLKNSYTTDTVLDDMRSEYKFSPAMVKEIAERIKKEAS